MNTKRFTCLQAIPFSFFSAELYRDIARNWRWTTFFYLCLVVAICSIPTTIVLTKFFNMQATQFVEKYLSQAPLIYITDGVARTPEKKPYPILEPGTKEVIGMVDTTGAHKNLDKEKFDVLVTANEIIVANRKEGEVKIQKFPEDLTITVDPPKVKEKLSNILKWSWVAIYPLIVLITIVLRFLFALLFALFGKLLAVFSEIPLMYEQILKMTMVAMTPAMVLSAIFWGLQISFRGEGWLIFAVTVRYVFFAVKANEVD